MKSQLTGKDPDAGKDGRQKEKRVVEGEMVRQHHRFNGHDFEQSLGDSGVQRILGCSSPWGHKKVRHDLTTEKQQISIMFTIMPWSWLFYYFTCIRKYVLISLNNVPKVTR